jgi:hypothetical protein
MEGIDSDRTGERRRAGDNLGSLGREVIGCGGTEAIGDGGNRLLFARRIDFAGQIVDAIDVTARESMSSTIEPTLGSAIAWRSCWVMLWVDDPPNNMEIQLLRCEITP